MQLKLQWKKNK